MNCLIFAIATVPDIDTGRRLHDMQGVDDTDVAMALSTLRYQHTDGRSDVLPAHLQRVVAIAVLEHRQGELACHALGDEGVSEAGLIREFFSRLERHEPALISWHGSCFELPVLHYRALLHGISVPRYWDGGADEHGDRRDQYVNRFHRRHTDLMDALSGFSGRVTASLDEISRMLGFPGGPEQSATAAWECYQAREFQTFREHCLRAVLNTYLIYLRFELLRGHLQAHTYEQACTHLRRWLVQSGQAALQRFLQAWPA